MHCFVEMARAKARAAGWQDSAALRAVPYGGIELLSRPGQYTVALFYDDLHTKQDDAIGTRVYSDLEILRSFFEIPDYDAPALAQLGPWALRVVYDEALGPMDMSCHGPAYDEDDTHPRFSLGEGILPPAPGPHDGVLVLFADTNAEKLIVHIRFTDDAEALLNKLLLDMCKRGTMADVDDILIMTRPYNRRRSAR
jgi:hypothetical protein